VDDRVQLISDVVIWGKFGNWVDWTQGSPLELLRRAALARTSDLLPNRIQTPTIGKGPWVSWSTITGSMKLV